QIHDGATGKHSGVSSHVRQAAAPRNTELEGYFEVDGRGTITLSSRLDDAQKRNYKCSVRQRALVYEDAAS
ncbi:hypothetical protein PFISCL1PPCAC_685, partial [Pristionchus fissidentatus]